VTTLRIINPIPGPKTQEQILRLIHSHNNGITLRELSRSLNRPVSMVQICLKHLISARQVQVSKSSDGMSLIYYPSHR
jgi:DNA-binding IclR family transcriptional regulator